MTFYAVDVSLYNRHDVAYRDFGTAEYDSGTDGDAYTKAFEYAHKRVALHPNAAACILRDGDPYAWVSNDVTDYAGTSRRDVDKPRVTHVGGSTPEWARH